MSNNVRVGVGVAIIKNGKLLLGKRLNSHGDNTYAFPGGHMEFKESWEETAVREVKEETGLDIKNVRLLGITNDIYENEDKHYITIITVADYICGEPETLEPNKCEGWNWYSLDEIPLNRFLVIENLLKSDLKEKLNIILEESEI